MDVKKMTESFQNALRVNFSSATSDVKCDAISTSVTPSSDPVNSVNHTIKEMVDDSEDVLLLPYVQGYEEINKFLGSMGKVFGFVSSDVISKINILKEHMQLEQDSDSQSPHAQQHYRTVCQMFAFEAQFIKNKRDSPGKYNGSRTLLRLHRALLFVKTLFSDAITGDESVEDMSRIAAHAYNESLAQHHPWLIRQTVSLALVTIPSKRTFFKKLFHLQQDDDQSDVESDVAEFAALKQFVVETTLPAMQSVYDRVQRLYEQWDFLKLS